MYNCKLPLTSQIYEKTRKITEFLKGLGNKINANILVNFRVNSILSNAIHNIVLKVIKSKLPHFSKEPFTQ